jgi:hypothetical protein
MSVFAKIFSQIFDSSISSDYIVRHTFMDLLVLADRDGVVDMTTDAISRRTNVPEEMIVHAIAKLAAPDAQSRSHEEDGCRLVPIDSHRSWGWQIVNYEHYRNLRDEEARRAYFRDAKREQRSKKCAKAARGKKTEAAKSRHAEFKAAILRYWESKNPGVEMPWGPAEGRNLEMWLRETPHTTLEQFVGYLRNRFKSEVNHTERPSRWIGNVTNFAARPIDKYGKPLQESANVGSDKNQQSPAKQRVDGARRVLAEIAIERGLYDPAGADGRPDAQVPQPGPAGEHR